MSPMFPEFLEKLCYKSSFGTSKCLSVVKSKPTRSTKWVIIWKWKRKGVKVLVAFDLFFHEYSFDGPKIFGLGGLLFSKGLQM
jgi:hypothetical protein